MPSVPFVDTHVHLWDPMRLGYDWLAGNDTLDRRHELPEFAAATAGLPLESMVFMECAVNAGQALDEARWVTTLARLEPRLKGMVASAPLEQGEAVRPHLEALAELPLLRGIRRLLQSEADDFCLQPGFVTGARMLAEFGLSFDICIFHRQLANVIAFADKVETVPMILDHIGKPGIADGLVSPWAEEMRELARRPNVYVAGFQTERGHACELVHNLQYLRPGVQLADIAGGHFGEILLSPPEDTTLVLIDGRRYSRLTRDLAVAAHKQAIPVTLITDPYCDWALETADEVFAVPTDLNHFWDTTSAMSSLIGLLVNGVFKELGAEVETRMAKISAYYDDFIGHTGTFRRQPRTES